MSNLKIFMGGYTFKSFDLPVEVICVIPSNAHSSHLNALTFIEISSTNLKVSNN